MENKILVETSARHIHLSEEHINILFGVLCGCMAGQPHVVERIKKSYPHVDGVFSTHHLWQFAEILYRVQ